MMLFSMFVFNMLVFANSYVCLMVLNLLLIIFRFLLFLLFLLFLVLAIFDNLVSLIFISDLLIVLPVFVLNPIFLKLFLNFSWTFSILLIFLKFLKSVLDFLDIFLLFFVFLFFYFLFGTWFIFFRLILVRINPWRCFFNNIFDIFIGILYLFMRLWFWIIWQF